MVGTTISHYKILSKLGEGGMGVVYKAHDTKLDRDVALKFLAHSMKVSENDQARFLQEARSAALLNHPNICTIYDVLEVDEETLGGKQSVIVMEYVEGKSLREMLPINTTKQATELGIQIASGLAADGIWRFSIADGKEERIGTVPAPWMRVQSMTRDGKELLWLNWDDRAKLSLIEQPFE